MSVEEPPKIEEIDSDDEMPALEETEEVPAGGDEAAPVAQLNRAEKKARKAMSKMGMKPVPGIVRATVKKSKTILFVVTKPDVFKSASAETYVVFGEVKIDDLSAAAKKAAASEFEAPAAAAPAPAAAPATEDGDDEDEDAGDIKESEIELCMKEASVSRGAAIKAIKGAGGDVVQAILNLTPM